MTDRQKTRYVLSTTNGMDIIAVGNSNMKKATQVLQGLKLTIRYDKKK